MNFRTCVKVAVFVLVPTLASPQALVNLSSVRVSYTTRKNTVKPEGELKAQLDALEAQIADAFRSGRTGEVRRLYAKGMTLLNGRPWTDAADYSASLVLRTPNVVIDSSKPYSVRLEQIYAPSISFSLQPPLSARIQLRHRPAPATPNQPSADPPVVKDFGTFEGVSRDLRESPFLFELDLNDVADGPYLLVADVLAGSERIGSASLAVALRKGLDALVARLESDASRATESVRADIQFPIDRMKNVNSGRLELRTFDPDRDFAAAEAVAAASKGGKDPFAGRTGDFKRHYLLEEAKEIIPYRVYVPTTYTQSKAFPLIVALHGLGATEDSLFDGYNKVLPPLAESHGYIVVAPLGYRVDGFYGWTAATQTPDPMARRASALSETDVMKVLQRMRQQYNIDENRIYLMGHSMGGIGTWSIAAKHPEIWAAIAPISGLGSPETLEKLRHVPEIIVHGDADPTVPVTASRAMVARLKELGVEHKYIEVPGGAHSDVVAPNIPAVIEFFDGHKKGRTGGTGG